MIRIILQDGKAYTGNNSTDIVTQLMAEDWTKYKDLEAYKKNINRRIMIFKGEDSRITYDNDDEFLEELQRVEFIKTIERI